jgi:hypothetical protein
MTLPCGRDDCDGWHSHFPQIAQTVTVSLLPLIVPAVQLFGVLLASGSLEDGKESGAE